MKFRRNFYHNSAVSRTSLAVGKLHCEATSLSGGHRDPPLRFTVHHKCCTLRHVYCRVRRFSTNRHLRSFYHKSELRINKGRQSLPFCLFCFDFYVCTLLKNIFAVIMGKTVLFNDNFDLIYTTFKYVVTNRFKTVGKRYLL